MKNNCAIICINTRGNCMENKNDGAKQFLSFIVIGSINSVVYYVSYALFVFLGMHYIPANAVGFVLSVLSSYLLNSRLVFKEDGSKEKRVWWRVLLKVFMTNAFTGLLLTSLLLKLWIDIVGLANAMEPLSVALGENGIYLSADELAEYIAPVINMLITTPMNFFINKFWTYRQKRRQGDNV